MEKINFPLEKTIFLPRGKAPIGKMEHVGAKAEVQTIEPAQSGWLCYGKLTIDLEYVPMGAGHRKSQEQWKNISQQLLSIGTDDKEQCVIEADFIQELPDRDYVFGSEFLADVQRKTWQQIASNALEISVDIALTVKERGKAQDTRGMAEAMEREETDFLWEQDGFALDCADIDKAEKETPPKKRPEKEKATDDIYYYADEEGCDTLTIDMDLQEDTVVFMPETEKEKPVKHMRGEDLLQKEICPCEEGVHSKGQHLYEKSEKEEALKEKAAEIDCERLAREEMARKEVKEKKEATKEMAEKDCVPMMPDKKSKGIELDCVCEEIPCPKTEETEKTEKEIKGVKEDICVPDSDKELRLDEKTLALEEDKDCLTQADREASKKDMEEAQEDKEDICQVVPLPLPGKEKTPFWKGKKGKGEADNGEKSFSSYGRDTAKPAEKPAEPRKGYRLKFYVVQGGEDLAAIAEKHCVSPSSILAANKNISEEDIRTGMVLSIPM